MLGQRTCATIGGLVASALLAAVPLGAISADAEEFHLTSPYPEGSYMVTNNRQFAEDVARLTEGRVEVVVHGGASLFKLPETKRAVQTGQAAMGEVLLGALANESAIHGVGMIPFLTEDIEDAAALWEAQRPHVARILEEQGLKLLHGVIWPGQSLFTSKEIASFDDLGGMKFRIQNPTTSRLAELMGVTGVRVETVDIPQAFLTGIIDGMYTSNVTTANLKGWDYIDYAYETNAWYPKNITFMNKGMFDSLSPEDQEAIMEASRLAEERGWSMESSETAEKTQLLRDNGVEVVTPPPALMEEFREIGGAMLAEWQEQAGQDGAELLQDYEARRNK